MISIGRKMEDEGLFMFVDGFATERKLMVKQQIYGRGICDSAVLNAMETIPRHEFVPKEERQKAYHDKPLPIGYDQTISQPYIVAFMTEVLGLGKDTKVLEIGTGSGYQTAVLSVLVKEVFAVEIVKPLGLKAAERLGRLGYKNVSVMVGDGYNGWKEHSPYDAVIVAAAPTHVPVELINQLKNGGKMIIPLGDVNSTQKLWLFSKDIKGRVSKKELLAVRFVPLTGAGVESCKD